MFEDDEEEEIAAVAPLDPKEALLEQQLSRIPVAFSNIKPGVAVDFARNLHYAEALSMLDEMKPDAVLYFVQKKLTEEQAVTAMFSILLDRPKGLNDAIHEWEGKVIVEQKNANESMIAFLEYIWLGVYTVTFDNAALYPFKFKALRLPIRKITSQTALACLYRITSKAVFGEVRDLKGATVMCSNFRYDQILCSLLNKARVTTYYLRNMLHKHPKRRAEIAAALERADLALESRLKSLGSSADKKEPTLRTDLTTLKAIRRVVASPTFQVTELGVFEHPGDQGAAAIAAQEKKQELRLKVPSAVRTKFGVQE
jgi:hypothetical protein